MKKIFTILLLLLPILACAETPLDPVIILTGASETNEQTPDNSPFGGLRQFGGSFTSIGEALTMLDVQVANEAQAAGYSFDIEGTGWRGYRAQLEHGISSTTWIDGVMHAKGAFFDLMNDCLHTVPCGEVGMDYYILNTTEAVNLALAAGLQVVVAEFPPWGTFDIAKALAPFGVTYTITQEEYEILYAKHHAAFASREDVTYLDIYDKASFIDGLHLDAGSAKRAAHKIKKAFK